MIKIIAGSARGRILKSPPKSPHVRPILARVKKSMFDIIAPRLPGARFLDMYCGTGPVGIEALSRGASSSCFMELDRICVKILKQNLAMLKMEREGHVYSRNVLGKLEFLPKPFDLIFMGPPYKDNAKVPLGLVTPTLANVLQHQLLAPKGLIIAQHPKKETVEMPTDSWTLFRQERYGETMLSFIKEL